MAEVRTIDRPQRWDLPFSRDLRDPNERRDLSEREIDQLLSTKLFADMDRQRFPEKLPLREIVKNDMRIRRYRNGVIIVRQEDYGNSAFLILGGSVRVVGKRLDQRITGRRERQRKNWSGSLLQLLTNPKSPEVRRAELYPQTKMIQTPQPQSGEPVYVQDTTNVLDLVPDAFDQAQKTPLMSEGQLFGELAALGRLAREATVVADGEAELLEIRWQGLRELRKYDEAFRKRVDEQLRKFGLAGALRASPLLTHLDDEDAKKVAETAEFETYGSFDWHQNYKTLRKEDVDPMSSEPVIAREGEYPNGLILIRAGFARLSRRCGHGEQTFGWLGKGEVYGLSELAHNARSNDYIALTATLRAVGYVDIVVIPTKTFEQLILPTLPADAVPDLSRVTRDAGRDTRDDITPALPKPARKLMGPMDTEGIEPAMIEFLVENRFINGTSTMVIDLDRCTRCDDCVRACASGHQNNPRFVRHGKIFDHYMVANACMHCVDAVCMIDCPTGAIHRSEESGEVVINDITCIGCGRCAASCPYDNIRMVEIRERTRKESIMVDPKNGRPILKATKCDLCVDHHGGPACERACPHDALKRVDMRDLNPLTISPSG